MSNHKRPNIKHADVKYQCLLYTVKFILLVATSKEIYNIINTQRGSQGSHTWLLKQVAKTQTATLEQVAVVVITTREFVATAIYRIIGITAIREQSEW